MKNLTLLIVNTVTLLFALVMNYLSSTKIFGGRTVGEVSALYENPFTPAGYAFAIWGLIYLLLIGFVIYQWVAVFRRKEYRELQQTGLWFSLANLANGFWIVAWLNLNIGLSVLIIFVLLLSLVVLTVRLNLERWDAPVRIIAFVWWPVTVYLGWVVVAAVANLTAFLVSIGWDGSFWTEENWAIVMIAVAMVIYLLLIYYRNMREAALVGIWALIAIAVRQWDNEPGIVWAALIAAGILFIYAVIQAWNNRRTLPFVRKVLTN